MMDYVEILKESIYTISTGKGWDKMIIITLEWLFLFSVVYK